MEKKKVYICAGWFDDFQVEALDYLEKLLYDNDKLKVYSPRKELLLKGVEGLELQNKAFKENCENIDNADLIIVSTVGKDMGTLWEAGYAYARNKKIIYTFFDKRFGEKVKFNLMLAASGIAAFTNKEKFETFLTKLLEDENSFNSLKQRYEGDFE